MYSKKKPVEQPCFDVPAGEKDPVGWIEKHCPYDPWERNATLIAGISSSSGPLMKQEPRNIAGDLVLGICPNFDALVSEILEAQEIQHLIRVTERGHMRMGHPKVKKTFRLHPELVDECQMLMLLSVRQALAGPRKEPELWIGKPVWRLADQIYHDHLNERNRTLQRAQRREIAPIKSQLYR
jgi:hypothetical protein